MLNQSFIPELQHESSSTRKMLEKVPAEKFGWKPHQKSMTLGRLAGHVAEIPDWLTIILTTDEFDIASGTFQRTIPETSEELMEKFERSYKKALETLQAATDESLMQKWTFKKAGHTVFSVPRIAALRSFVISHFIHHRGQLSVYLRLLDVPVPGMYGPSGDEQ